MYKTNKHLKKKKYIQVSHFYKHDLKTCLKRNVSFVLFFLSCLRSFINRKTRFCSLNINKRETIFLVSYAVCFVRSILNNNTYALVRVQKTNKCWVIIYFKGQLFWEIFSLLDMRFKQNNGEEEIAYT